MSPEAVPAYWCPRCKSARILRGLTGPRRRGLCLTCGTRWIEKDDEVRVTGNTQSRPQAPRANS